MIMILLFLVIVALVASGAIRMERWKSSVRMINAAWLADDERFKLISRWGRIG